MCTNKITIVNRSRRYRFGIDKPFLRVPCGHCEQCQQRKCDDWFVRACAEFKRVKDLGGFVLFPTLTYSPKYVPIWRDKENNFSCPCFDKNHFRSFRNKLRVYLKRAGYDFTGENTIRYLYVSEYGGQYGRPHYHVALFVPSFIPYLLFKALVKKAWIYGMVRYSPNGDCLVSVQGLKYAMKYMHKDQLYYDKYKIDEYLNNLKLSAKHNIVDMIKLRKFKRTLPHHCQSMGFGSDLSISDDEFIHDRISSSRLGLFSLKFTYHVPMYYKRKFLFDFDKVNSIYTINARGIKIKQDSFNLFVDSIKNYYDSIFKTSIVNNLIDSYFSDLKDNSGYYDFLKMFKYDSLDIGIFALCYRGLNVRTVNYEVFDEMSEMDFLKENRDNSYFFYCASVDNIDAGICFDYKLNGALESFKYVSYSDLNIYRLFESGLSFLELFEKRLGEHCNNSLYKQYYNQSIQFGRLFNYI